MTLSHFYFILRARWLSALASGLLTRTIATLKQSHPRLSMSIQVDTSDVLVQALLQDQLDIVLGRIPAGARAEELLFDSLGEEALCVIASAQNPLAKEKHLSWAELQNMTWVLQQQPSPMRAIINQVFHNARVDIPSSIVETTSIMTLLSLIQQTDMLGVTPVSVVLRLTASITWPRRSVPDDAASISPRSTAVAPVADRRIVSPSTAATSPAGRK